ncbi:MAG: hypothetical protein Q4C94_04340, partial [Neisseria sp.]|nr:hypothetical protein [Neisseria sp.]
LNVLEENLGDFREFCKGLTLPDSRSINYLYYGSGHLHQINLDGETLTDIERDKLHQEISRSQGALTSLFDYDPMGRLKNQCTVYGDNRKQSALIGGVLEKVGLFTFFMPIGFCFLLK